MDSELNIDIYNLDTECVIFPELLMSAYSDHADAVAARDSAKVAMRHIYIDIELDVRLNYKTPQGKPPTDKMTEALVHDSAEHKKAWSDYLSAKYKADKAEARKEALLKKAHMIDLLCKLYLSDHYSEVTTKRFKNQTQEHNFEVSKKLLLETREAYSRGKK